MNEKLKAVDDLFSKLVDKEEANESLSIHEQIVLDTWHHFGLLQNGGLHNYFCELEDSFERISSSFKAVNLIIYENLEKAHHLFSEYKTLNKYPEADQFRENHEELLDHYEDTIYEQEDKFLERLYLHIKDSGLD